MQELMASGKAHGLAEPNDAVVDCGQSLVSYMVYIHQSTARRGVYKAVINAVMTA